MARFNDKQRTKTTGKQLSISVLSPIDIPPNQTCRKPQPHHSKFATFARSLSPILPGILWNVVELCSMKIAGVKVSPSEVFRCSDDA